VKVGIDAGHGMNNAQNELYDPGAVATHAKVRYEEAEIALQWALTGKWVLGQRGIETFLTRDDDRDSTPLGMRDDRMRAEKCTHAISVHCNAASLRTPSGPECIIANEASEAHYIYARETLAACMSAMNRGTRGVKREKDVNPRRPRELAILNRPGWFPGGICLLEIGFITNPHDVQRMVLRDVRIEFWERFADFLQGVR
jgi:N-acetylmuramoyl-L-alanine amidase